MSKNLNFWHLIPLNPRIKIFPKYGITFKWCPLLPSTIMQKIRNFRWPVSEKMSKNPNFWHLIPLNPRINIFFQNSCRVTFFTLWTCKTSCKVSEKTNEWSVRYSRQTDWGTTELTNGRRATTREITMDTIGWTQGPKCKLVNHSLIMNENHDW